MAGVGLAVGGFGAGHETGKNAGHDSGYEAGEKAGKAIGVEEGEKVGLQQGEEAGRKAGFAEGKAKGMEEGKTTAQEVAVKAAETKIEKEEREKEETEEFSESQHKLREGLDSLRIDKYEEKRFKASKDAAEIADKAFGIKVKEALGGYTDWLRTKNTKEVEGSADIIISMTQTESGFKLVQEKVRTDGDFKVAVEDLFSRMSSLRDNVANTGNNLEGENYLAILDKDDLSKLDITYDDNYENVLTATETVEKINKATGETETEEREVSKKEVARREKNHEEECQRQSRNIQDHINVLAKVLAENTPEAK